MMGTGIFGRRGNVSILVACILVFLFGIAALVIDVGLLHVERRSMVTAADAAVLAGTRELVLTGEESAALEVARNYAQANGAEITDEISIETITHNGESFQAVVARVGVNKEHFFARLLGFTDQDVMARAVAAWGYPTSYLNVFPFFYIIQEGYELPEGEVLLLNPSDEEEFAPGNWGYLRAGRPGKKEIKDVLSGKKESELFLIIGDDISGLTETGIPKSTIKHGIEERMIAAADPDSGITMEGVIPIIREITGQGSTTVVIVGFAPFEILDVITAVTKEEGDRWWGRGSVYAHFLDAPRLYSVYEDGYEKKQDADKDYPKGTIVGRFIAEKFIPSRHFIEISQNPEHNFGVRMVKLIE